MITYFQYVHYEIDYPENVPMTKPDMAVMKKTKDNSTILYPPQVQKLTVIPCLKKH